MKENRRRLRFDGDEVFKPYFSDVKVEYCKAVALWNLSQKEDFQCPEPLELNEVEQTISYRFLSTQGSLREQYINFMKDHSRATNGKVIELIKRAGEVLGAIHKGLTLKIYRKWEPSGQFYQAMKGINCSVLDSFLEQCPHALLHGDYGFANIEHVDSDFCRIALFDPSPNYFTTFHPHTYGPVYLDIGNFFSSLDGLVPISNYPMMKWNRLQKLKDAFLAGYQAKSNFTIDPIWVGRFSYGSAFCYFHYKYRSRILRAIAIRLLFNMIKNNLPKRCE